MSALIHIKNVTFTDLNLPVIDMEPPLDPPETGAAGHYLLSSDSAAYENIQTAGSLGTLVELGTAPMKEADGITVDSSKSLDTGFAPAADYTVCFVARKETGLGMLLGGNFTAGTQKGFLVNAFTDEMRLAGGDVAVTLKQPLSDDSADQWVFVAVRVEDGVSASLYCPQAIAETVTVSNVAITSTMPSPNFVIGGVNYTGGFSVPTAAKLAEVIIFETLKSDGQLAAIYARSKQRMADQGVVLIG